MVLITHPTNKNACSFNQNNIGFMNHHNNCVRHRLIPVVTEASCENKDRFYHICFVSGEGTLGLKPIGQTDDIDRHKRL